MYKVVKNKVLVPNFHEMEVYHPRVAKKANPGQFVIVRAVEKGERIPLSISDTDAEKGTVTIVFEKAGASTRRLARVGEGSSLSTFTGPLGTPSEVNDFGTVLLIGGCYGIGAIYPFERALKEKGNKVIVGLEARNSSLIYWREKHLKFADSFYVLTRDGSEGLRGHVDDLIRNVLEKEGTVNMVYAVGCTFMMRKVSETTKPFGIKTVVSLNPLMVDGTGMCGVCRVNVGGKTKFACVDGPDFDGHKVDWDVLIMRKKAYLSEEIRAFTHFECEKDFGVI